MISGVPIRIRTECLQNILLEIYYSTRLFAYVLLLNIKCSKSIAVTVEDYRVVRY
jgi:hypothetical protein